MTTQIRPAVVADLDGIMILEEETFGAVAQETMALRETMQHRIKLLNSDRGSWFWVADFGGQIVATMIMQPTDVTPATCVSWHAATDGGMLTRTFNPDGKNLYGVSLAISKTAPKGTIELLMHVQFFVWLKGRHRYFMICSRIPGYREAFEKTKVSPEDYWRMKDAVGRPVDWMLRHFSEFVGVKPVRLLPGGFPEDPESLGNGVLCVGTMPVQALYENIVRLGKAGIKIGWLLS